MCSETITNYIQDGIKAGLIKLYDDDKRIEYVLEKKSRNYANPEEQVQAEAYCRLILQYGYPKQRVKNFISVTMGVEKKEADIVVYNDDECLQPHILVECKKQEVSESEFNQAVNQAYSYSFALPNNVKYVWVTSQIKNEFFQVDKLKNTRKAEPDIPAYGVNKLAPYKFVKGADKKIYKEGEQKFFDIRVVSEDDLTRRFKQAHDALWAGGQLNPSEAFDELDKLIFCKIWDERKAHKVGTPYDFQVILEEGKDKDDALKKTNAALFARLNSLYEEGRKKDPEVFKDNIRLTHERARTIVEYLQEINLSKTDLDSKGRAFETFMDSFFRGSFGQYFTPRPIVKFIVDVLPISHDSLVLDTSCGSGGFLLHALEKVRRQANELFPDFEDIPDERLKWHRHWHEFAQKNLYGIEINEQIGRAAKMNMIIHDDGHTNVITEDGLLKADVLRERSKNQGFEYGRFDFIITNPPFGSAVRLNEQAYLKEYGFGGKEASWLDIKNSAVKDRETQSTEILFIEQAHNFLNEGGYLAIVIPDGILTNSSMQYVRDQIEEWFRLIAVVSLPQSAFAATGAGVKSSVLFLRKHTKKQTEKLQQQKLSLQNNLKNSHQYKENIESIEREKQNIIKNATGAVYEGSLSEFKKTESYKDWKAEISSYYNEKIITIKENLVEDYQSNKNSQRSNYKLLMAIAEDIGYNATGKKTATNELDFIGRVLANFIQDINDGHNQNPNILSTDHTPSQLKERIFFTQLNEISGSIFNPKTYLPKSKALFSSIQSSTLPIKRLKDLIVHRCAGDWGKDEDYKSEVPNQFIKCLVIRGTEFDNEFNLCIASGREKYRMIAAVRLNKMEIEEGDILIEKSGGSEDQPVGRVAIIEADLLDQHKIGYSNFVEKIKPNKQIVHPAYLFNYLKFLHAIGITDLIQSQTNGIRNLMMPKYLNLPIAIPPMPQQLEIVKNIEKLRNEAISMRNAANEKLLQAQDVVKSVILGETS